MCAGGERSGQAAGRIEAKRYQPASSVTATPRIRGTRVGESGGL
jgi:hypothetical protein